MPTDLAAPSRSILEPLLEAYRDTDFAYSLATLMMWVAGALCLVAIIHHVLRSIAVDGRTRAISSFIVFDAGTAGDDKESTFAARFNDIDGKMVAGGILGGGLADAWRRYRRTLIFTSAPPIRSTQGPGSYFSAVVPPPSWLGFAGTMFVAIGLLATFLGLVAALTFAADGMKSDDLGQMQVAVRDLLAAASSKFVTSVAGVALSIVLRLLERLLTVSIRGKVARLSRALESGIRVDRDAHTASLTGQIARFVDRLDGGAALPPTGAHRDASDA